MPVWIFFPSIMEHEKRVFHEMESLRKCSIQGGKRKKFSKRCDFTHPKIAHRTSSKRQNHLRMVFRVRQTHFEHHFQNLVKKVLIDHFHCTGNTKAFQRTLKSLRISCTVKIIDRNFFDQIFKMMLKMSLPDPKPHPEVILNI